MGLFDVFKTKTSEKPDEGGFNLEIIENKPKEPEELMSILDGYSTGSTPQAAEITGTNLFTDLGAAARTFASRYFQASNVSVEEVKNVMEELSLKMDELDRLSLGNTENYKKLKEKFDSLRDLSNKQNSINRRLDFAHELCTLVPSLLILGYDDFKIIAEKYGYTRFNILRDWVGEVTDRNIGVLRDIRKISSSDHILYYNISVWKEDTDEIFGSDQYYIPRLSYIDKTSNNNECSDGVELPNPEILVFRKESYKSSYRSSNDTRESISFWRYNKVPKELTKHPLFGTLSEKTFEFIKSKKPEDVDTMFVFGEVIGPNTAALAISPEHPENLPLLFQIFNNGVLIYDMIGLHDYAKWPDMKKYYLKPDEKKG